MNDLDKEPVAEFAKFLKETDIIFRIGSPKMSLSERLQLLTYKLIILLWDEQEDNVEKMDEKLQLIDNIRHELSFLRAEYYKKVFNKKANLPF